MCHVLFCFLSLWVFFTVSPVFSSFVSPVFTPCVFPLSVVRLFALGTGVSSVFLPVFLVPYLSVIGLVFFVSAPSVFVLFEWNQLAFCCFYLPARCSAFGSIFELEI